jgi:hypothetical protein
MIYLSSYIVKMKMGAEHPSYKTLRYYKTTNLQTAWFAFRLIPEKSIALKQYLVL